MSGVIPVLLYHSVDDEPARERRYAVSRRVFESHLDAVAASGRRCLLITELAMALRGARALPDRAIAITFDDGFADTYDAVESLVGRGLRATVYVTSSEVGCDRRLDQAQVTELARSPAVEIGAHAVRHRYLDELDDPEVAREVSLSKRGLEDMTQSRVDSFAYPHGAYDARVRRAVIDAGYRSAAGVKNAVCHARDDPFAIARWTVTWGTPAARVAQVLEGEDVPMAWGRERLRTRAYRTARRRRRRLARALGART